MLVGARSARNARRTMIGGLLVAVGALGLFDRAHQSATPERTAAGRRAVEDESNFIDFKRSTMWLAKEHVFVDHM